MENRKKEWVGWGEKRMFGMGKNKKEVPSFFGPFGTKTEQMDPGDKAKKLRVSRERLEVRMGELRPASGTGFPGEFPDAQRCQADTRVR